MSTAEPVAPSPEADEPTPEPVAVEVVERPAASTELAVPPAKSALEHAAEELMATPGAPGRDEFLVLATTARILSMSRGAPKAVRSDPWLAFHLALIGRDLGISPSAAIAQIDVIGEGENAQLSISPELLNAQIKRLGLGSVVPVASSDMTCTAVAMLPGGRLDPRCARTWPEHVDDERRPCTCTFDLVLGEHTFTWDNAQQAGLAHRDCASPSDHTDVCRNGGQNTGGKRCHQGYRTYPKRMMWWRAAGYASADYFPEASVGLYSPEELGAVVDPETGRPYDPATVELPEGFEPPERPPNPQDDYVFSNKVTGDEYEPPEDLAKQGSELRGRVEAIKAAGGEATAALRELWEQLREDESRLTPPIDFLQRRHLVRARAITKQVEDRIKREEWGDEAKSAWIDASMTGNGFGAGRTPAVDPEAAPSPSEQVDTPPDAPEGSTGDVGLAGGEPVTPERLMDACIGEVKAMRPTDVTSALTERAGPDGEVVGNMQAQRQQLALALYLERGGPMPEGDAS